MPYLISLAFFSGSAGHLCFSPPETKEPLTRVGCRSGGIPVPAQRGALHPSLASREVLDLGLIFLLCAGLILVRTSLGLTWEPAGQDAVQTGLLGGLHAFYLGGLPLRGPWAQLLWHLFGPWPQDAVRRWSCLAWPGRGESPGASVPALWASGCLSLKCCKMHRSGSAPGSCSWLEEGG